MTIEAEQQVSESGDKIRKLFLENPQAQTVFPEIFTLFKQPPE
ncbi:MAG: hypothetical protein Q7V05_01885 [Methanoregula sp.]|nr:hypothetical protein [Methanoregula sp.]